MRPSLFDGPEGVALAAWVQAPSGPLGPKVAIPPRPPAPPDTSLRDALLAVVAASGCKHP